MADGGAVSVADVEVWIDSRLEWVGGFTRRRAGGRGVGGTDGAGEGVMNPEGRDIASSAERSRGVGAGMDVELFLIALEVGAVFEFTSVRLDVFIHVLEAEKEGFGGRDEAGLAVSSSNGSVGAGTSAGLGLDFATDGFGAGRVVGFVTGEPQPASLAEWFATGDLHPPVLSLTGDLQPPSFARGEFRPPFFPELRPVLSGGGEPHPTPAVLVIEVDCTRVVAWGRFVQEDLEVSADDVVVVSFLDTRAETGGSRPLIVEAGSGRETERCQPFSRSCSY